MKENKKIIFGVSSWIANKLNTDASLIRIAFIIGVFVFGTGIGIYLLLWIVKILEEKN